MFALRTVVFGALARGVRAAPSLVSAGRAAAQGQTRPLAAGPCVLHVCRPYSTEKSAGGPSQLDELPPTMLKKEYLGINAEEINDVVKRLLSLDMASQSDKLKVKIQQLVDKVRRDPDDRATAEVRIAVLTARIQNFKEHLQLHPKDKANKRRMLMSIDRRKKLLKSLRRTRYDSFEHVCTELNIEYTFPPEYYRRATKRWIAKKAFCLQVHKEAKKLRAEKFAEKVTEKKHTPKSHAPLYVFPQPTD
ncbi:hypothetical protein GDO78_001037 [Eleutherodactylus coqui]|uniref:Small ribosomal subunit protein uS15m n=1 Tax=Eleutherodactylus coqui TaxID=57060 RepID=A0A8J6FU46_ELECQ|nr:hypothetical protein GDO78_001037 [Eleutherodactylus coqui]